MTDRFREGDRRGEVLSIRELIGWLGSTVPGPFGFFPPYEMPRYCA